MRTQPQQRARGFTLIELMIAVAVVAILAAVAYPSYLSSIRKSRRSDAKSGLVAAAQAMERLYTERGTYAGATLGNGGIYPDASTNGYYTLSLATQSATAFTLAAAPVAAQTEDACGSFTYDQAGTKGVSGGSQGVANCW